MAVLREPRRRILSFYRFILLTEDHPLKQTVLQNSQDFGSFLRLASREQKIQDAVDNVQVRMLSGDMGLTTHGDYRDHLTSALANTRKRDFLFGDIETLDGLTVRLAEMLSLQFGPLPRLNMSKGDRSFDEEMHLLAPDARDALERFAKWDALLHAEASQQS
jgi:hypothetical protein